MPLVRLQTSAPLDEETRQKVATRLSSTTAWLLGKPESYVMVAIEPEVTMLMGGEAGPCALVEVRSVGTVSAEQARALSHEFTKVLTTSLGVEAERIYANYVGVPGALWGHGDSTFG